jgi:hypothetical protein
VWGGGGNGHLSLLPVDLLYVLDRPPAEEEWNGMEWNGMEMMTKGEISEPIRTSHAMRQ